MSKKKTIEKWGEHFSIRVLDPDGFDRNDPKLMEKKFTKDEFFKGVMSSTIIGNVRGGGLFSELDKWYKKRRAKND